MIRRPLVEEERGLRLLKNMGIRGVDPIGADDEKRSRNSIEMTSTPWTPSAPTALIGSSPSPSSSPSLPATSRLPQWSPRFQPGPPPGGSTPVTGLSPAEDAVAAAAASLRNISGAANANWQHAHQASGNFLSMSMSMSTPTPCSTPMTVPAVAGTRVSPTSVVPGSVAATALPPTAATAAPHHHHHHMLPMNQGLPALSQMYSPYFEQMECRDANSSAAAAAVLGWPYSQLYYASYDPMLGQVGGYPADMAGGRRKNATRETTSTLKAWLKEHKKNPYPTKGEKIMLAIISKMTLTQVSTWFANARRRLKKENKMMWDSSSGNNNQCRNSDRRVAGDGAVANEDGDGDDSDTDNQSEKSNTSASASFSKTDSRLTVTSNQPSGLKESANMGDLCARVSPEPKHRFAVSNGNDAIKPKIWSIVDTVRNPAAEVDTSSSSSSTPQVSNGQRAGVKRPRSPGAGDAVEEASLAVSRKARILADHGGDGLSRRRNGSDEQRRRNSVTSSSSREDEPSPTPSSVVDGCDNNVPPTSTS